MLRFRSWPTRLPLFLKLLTELDELSGLLARTRQPQLREILILSQDIRHLL